MTKKIMKQDPARDVEKTVESVAGIIASSGPSIKIGDIYYHDGCCYDFWMVRKFNIADNYRLPTVEVEMVGVDRDGIPADYYCSVTHRELQESRGYILLDIPAGKSIKECIAEVEEEGYQALRDPSRYLEILESLEKTKDKSIVSVDQKEILETTQSLLEQQDRRVRLVQEMMKSKVDALSWVANRLQKQLNKIKKMIGVIELYLGVAEEIFQIQGGEPAPASEPISIRQLVLYMDEETGIYEGGGIDCTNVDEFDAWLLEKNHLEIVLPERKGMVILCPSRQDKYHGDDFYNSAMKEANLMAYLLIRNGDNVYRIWTSIKMGERFFPTLAESEKIEILFEEASQKGCFGFDAEKAQDNRFLYLRNTFLIQGLIDRTRMFEPLPCHIDFFKPETYAKDGPIRLIRDDELQLPSGRVPYREWKKELNSHITRGSRVYLSRWQEPMSDNQKYHWYYSKRFTVYRNWYPEGPGKGLYVVQEIVQDKDCCVRILYQPNPGWRDEYKRRLSFLLYRDEYNLLNYDRISLEDLEFYIYNRVERRNFLSMLPVLVELRHERLKEIEDEKGFVKLMSQNISIPEEKIWEAIEWWKNKVIWRRPIRKDDALAWRMIYRRLGKENAYAPEPTTERIEE